MRHSSYRKATRLSVVSESAKKLPAIFVFFLGSLGGYSLFHAPARVHVRQSDRDFAFRLYTTILNAADSANGLIEVKLKAFSGRTNGSHIGQSAFWSIAPETTTRIKFEFQNNSWKTLEIDFGEHPLTITLAVDTPAPGTLRIRKITYRPDGKVRDLFEPGNSAATTEFVRKGQSHADSLGSFSELLSAIKIAPQLGILLAGQNLSAGPLNFDSVRVNADIQENLQFTLKPATDLPLGGNHTGGCNLNSFTLTEKLPLVFSELSFEPSAKNLNARIDGFTARLTNACLDSGDTVFNLAANSQIEVSQLRFGQRTGSGAFLSLQANRIRGGLLAGSNLVLTENNGRKNALTMTDTARLEGGRFGFEIKEDGTRGLSLSSGNISLNHATGVLSPDADNDFRFKTSAASLSIVTGEWVSNAVPKLQGSISPMQIQIGDGELAFNRSNKLVIQSGSANTGQLTIDTSGPVPVSGVILPTALTFGANSVIGTPNRLALEAQGGTLIDDRANRLTFSRESPGINGQVKFSLPNTRGKIDFGNDLAVAVNSGSLEAVLARPAGASFTGQIKGHLLANAGRIPLGQNASAGIGEGQFDFDRLEFSETNGLRGPLTGLTIKLAESQTSLSATCHIVPSGNALIDLLPSTPPPEITDSGLKGSVHINAPFSKGEARMAAGGFFQFGAGNMSGTITAADNAPTVGNLKLVTELSGGVVNFDSATALTLTSGSNISANLLTLNQDGNLSGSISGAHFQLQPGSALVAARGRKLIIDLDSTYDEQEGTPLSFSVGLDSPTGEGRLSVKFSELKYPSPQAVSLRKGEVRALLSRSSSDAQPLAWRELVIKGDQIGSYASVAEMPDDEYSIVSRRASGSLETISVPNRVMIVNTVPIAPNTNATFGEDGRLSRAILADDATVFGVPLQGGSPIEIDAGRSTVLVGTLGRDATIDGVPYSKGCLAHLPPTDADRVVPPCEKITSLAFRIKTSNAPFSGAYFPLTNLQLSLSELLKESKDDIWIDIGPNAWRIPFDSKTNLSSNIRITGDFHTGETATVEILNPAIGEGGVCSALSGPDVPLYVGDIRGVRLEKKGIFLPNICGLAEGPDSDLDLVPDLLRPPTPADLLKNLKVAMQAQKEVNEAKRKIVEGLGHEFDDLQKEIDKIQSLVQAKRQEITNAQHRIVDLQNQILDLPTQLCHDEKVAIIGCVAINPLSCFTLKAVCAANPAIQSLKDRISGVERDIINLQSFIDNNLIKGMGLAAKLDLQAGKLATKLAIEAEIKATNFLIDHIAQPVADELQQLIDHLLPGLDLPLPGTWKPESITVIVNGRDFATFTVNERLRQGHSFWEGRVRRMSDGEYFVQGLRVNVVKVSGSFDLPSGATTPLVKMRGFTGWDVIKDLGDVTLVGVLQHDTSEGADAGVSLDLKINRIEVNRQGFELTGTKGIRHDRYIRVEYQFGTDRRFRSWHKDDIISVKGTIKRDRDRTTFYEIHINDPSDINKIGHLNNP